MSEQKDLKRVAYYPGCTLEGTGHAYDRSTRAVGKELGLDLLKWRTGIAVALWRSKTSTLSCRPTYRLG